MEREDALKDTRAAFEAGLAVVAPGSEAAKAYQESIAWIDSQGVKPTPAVAAVDFVNRISLQTHLNWRNTVWGSNPAWRDQFKDLKVRYTRSQLGTSAPGMADLRYIGAKLILVIDDHNAQGDYDKVRAQRAIDFAAANADVIHCIEGPNEPNAPGASATWAAKVKDYQQWLYTQVNAKPELRDKPVVGPSIWGRETNGYKALGDISGSLDIGNLHYYTGGRWPPISGFPSSYDETGDPDKTYSLDDALREAAMIAPNKPTWITEVGWPVAGPNRPLDQWNCTDLAQAKYNIRMLCESYIRGIQMTNIYTLIDDIRNPPYYHGLVKQDLSKRASFNALKRTISIFDDNAGGQPPTGLVYTASDNAKVKALPLMQKLNGSFLIGLWQPDAESYSRTTFKDNTVPAQPVILDFAGKTMNIRTYAPTVDTGWATRTPAAMFNAQVPDHLLVVEVTPQ